ncbi:MAG: alanine--tRNA ligase [Bacteroidetes bacterium]|nr:alanine--tRNA ligase [Bacteroidota bacterium]
MNSSEIRKTFTNFFVSKNHTIVPSSPMVVKNDPTLMFTNAGMNQFKDIFLGNSPAKYNRVANSQKCLRVSGKHNDLEEVGHDTYHHTMFEMLGNWSFGDYFKKEAIEWAWELLTDVYKIDKSRMYVTVFEGDKTDGIPADTEALNFWKTHISEDRIIYGSKKDNFWEMGDTGPCGPCSEIHVDIRGNSERQKTDGKTLVNKGDPHVIEIWNLVFIEFNRLSDGKLIPLPAKHVDTGMGFERLCMVIQGKKSNYDTDVFQVIINKIAELSGKKYGNDTKADIAMRVIADHIRAISFAIADGQLPSNNKAGYVIRRILRRAVRYGYTYLNLKEPFIHELVSVLVNQMGEVFPELKAQQDLIRKVIAEEEIAFLRTLSVGIQKFDNYLQSNKDKKIIDCIFTFELCDTFGFPVDLTQLMAKEQSWDVDMQGFDKCMEEQKNRSRKAAVVDTEDWVELQAIKDTEFVGYDNLTCEVKILKYRKIKVKEKEFFQIVLDKTPFYAESGGQLGDRGYLEANSEKISIDDTKKENNLTIHFIKKLPKDIASTFKAVVDNKKRVLTENNHSATHLLHAALKIVLGTHVEQKGSMVSDERLRFDFAHFSKMTNDEIAKVETIVNEKIRENIVLEDMRNIPIAEAQKMGAVALFGEKYGDKVRVVSFDRNFSMELCGGTHAKATGQIGFFKIISESAIAAGIRRIEAITAVKAEQFMKEQLEIIANVQEALNNPKDIVKGVTQLIEQNNRLQKQIEEFQKEKIIGLKNELKAKAKTINGINFIAEKVELDANGVKDLAYFLKNDIENLFLVLASVNEGKPGLAVMISENLVSEKSLDASKIVRELAKEIQGGGGGQPFFATAGGKNIEGIDRALEKAEDFIKNI